MKRKQIFILISLMIALFSCEPPENFLEPTSSYQPILIERREADKLIKFIEPQEVTEAGNFYIYRTYLLFIEVGKGIHVFDNTDQSDPKNIGFLTVANVTNLAITNDVLYVNQSVDLVAIDVSDLNNVKVTSRIEDISIYEFPPDGLRLQDKYLSNRPPNTIVAEWRLIDEEETNVTYDL